MGDELKAKLEELDFKIPTSRDDRHKKWDQSNCILIKDGVYQRPAGPGDVETAVIFRNDKAPLETRVCTPVPQGCRWINVTCYDKAGAIIDRRSFLSDKFEVVKDPNGDLWNMLGSVV